VGIVLAAVVIGVGGCVAFAVIETRSPHPMVPLAVFRSKQFSGANLVTVAVYGALGVATFLVVVHLQTNLGYSALEAGAALLPITVVMLLLSARMGALSQHIGPRLPMTVGPVLVGAGMLMLSSVDEGTHYFTGVFPGVLVLAFGLAVTVSPLTAAVLAAIDDHHAGVGSAINNAAARIASLLAIAVVPAAVGLSDDFLTGYRRALVLSGVLAAAGGLIGYLTIRTAAPVEPATSVPVGPSCHDPCTKLEDAA
jgi:predicted MFS family arabinose efflux permease